jgi:hypothetical protein
MDQSPGMSIDHCTTLGNLENGHRVTSIRRGHPILFDEIAMADTSKRPMARTLGKRAKVKPVAKGRTSASGAVAANFHEGRRSEILADYTNRLKA